MKIYQNTFEVFGDPSPAEATSKRTYARRYLNMFSQLPTGDYKIPSPEVYVASLNELQWARDVWADATPVSGEFVPIYVEECRTMTEDRLLDHLEKAVEEVRMPFRRHQQRESVTKKTEKNNKKSHSR
ncbi:MAG: hypothetical protein JO279_09120 [Verrucomicrobia bacterium]|nr:hypothetical protein [Verrucomicrobiota bacterium]